MGGVLGGQILSLPGPGFLPWNQGSQRWESEKGSTALLRPIQGPFKGGIAESFV